MLENRHLYGLTEMDMYFLVGAFFGAGTDSVRCFVDATEIRLLDCCSNMYRAKGGGMFRRGVRLSLMRFSEGTEHRLSLINDSSSAARLHFQDIARDRDLSNIWLYHLSLFLISAHAPVYYML
ncbi:hypothetical protein EDD22DRAFT_370137 [Suillus occidentalis]|nr:hypothetical protein EDD22DRAFT_370137 [Suillus occidentalis]